MEQNRYIISLSENSSIDTHSRTFTDDSGNLVELTRRQWDVLTYLVERVGDPLSHEEIYQNAWHYETMMDSPSVAQAVRDTIAKLRAKSPSLRKSILTVRGFGFRFVPPENEKANENGLSSSLTRNIVPFIDEDSVLHRTKVLRSLIEMLTTGKSAVNLTGMGGIGKTAIARVLYHKLMGQFSSIGWVKYSGDLQNSLLSAVSLFENISDSRERWSVLSTFLKHDNTPKLMIIDNVDADIRRNQDPLSDHSLQEFSGWPGMTILITSRIPEIQGYISYPLTSLEPDECEDLFYHYYNTHRRKASMDSDGEDDAVCHLVELAGRHTYAIELLARGAKYADSLSNYLRCIQKTGFRFPTLEFMTAHSNISATAAVQLRYLFDLQTRSAQERQALLDFSALPPVELSFPEIQSWLGYSDNNLDHLIDEGWLQYGYGVQMHPLVKEAIVLSYTDEKAPAGTVQILVEKICSGHFISEEEPFDVASRKWEIAKSIVNTVNIPDHDTQAQLYFQLGTTPFSKYQPADAIHFLRKALVLFEDYGHNQEAHIATCCNDIGYYLSYTINGRDEAEEFLRKALVLRRCLGTTDVPEYSINIATSCDYLGYLLSDQITYYQEAENLLRESLAIRSSLAVNDKVVSKSDVAWTMDNLGFLLSHIKDSQREAENLLRMALHMRLQLAKKHPGKHIDEVAWTYNNLALLLYAEGDRMEEARALYLEALTYLRQDEKNTPGLHLADMALCYGNLGVLTRSDLTHAAYTEELFQQALHINRKLDEQFPGMYRAEVAVSCNNIATIIMLDISRQKEAESLYQEAIQINASLEEQHPGLFQANIADITFNLAVLSILSNGCTQKSTELLDQAISIWINIPRSEEKITMAEKLQCISGDTNILSHVCINYIQSGARTSSVFLGHIMWDK